MRRHLLLSISVLLAVPAIASATVTSHVSTPASGTRIIVNQSSPPTLHIAGTATGTSGAVDLYCVSSVPGGSATARLIAANVPVDGSNAFATSPDPTFPASSPFDYGLCEIIAIDHGAPAPTDNSQITNETGPQVYEAYNSNPSITGGKTYDFLVGTLSTAGEQDFASFGSCGLDFSALVNPGLHETDGFLFDCNGFVDEQDPNASSPQPTMVIDGHPAYSTDFIGSNASYRGLPGWNGLTYSVTDAGGAWDVASHEGVFECANTDAFPPSTCTGFKSSGVDLTYDEKTSADNRTDTQTIRFASSDNQPHTLSVVLDQETYTQMDWLFPGTGGFQPYGIGATPSTIAPAVATIRAQLHTNPTPESITKGVAAITYVPTPAAEQFWNANDEFTQRWTNLTIPAGKAVRLVFIYNMNATSAGLDTQVAAAEASIGAAPSIAVTSPATASGAAYTLTGTVTAPETLNAFTVNGQSVAVGSDGSFSVPETLALGANSFTLAATDELSRTTSTSFGVTRGSSPPPGNVVLPVVFGRSGKPRLTGRTLTTGATAKCPGTGPNCSITAAASVGRTKAGSGTATVKAGATVKLKIKLTKAGLKLFKRTHKLTLKLKGARTGAKTTSATQTVKLKAKKKG